MKNRILFNVLILLLTSIFGSCHTIDIQEEVISMAQDSRITKEEFFKLQSIVVKEAKYKKYSNSPELHNYLLKLFDAKKLQIEVYNPQNKKVIPFSVNIYFENSHSMDGYIPDVDLKGSLYDMLVNIKKISGVINLNYINSKIINVPSQNIQQFSTGLTSKIFKNAGGNRGNSDIADVVKNVLSKTNDKNMSVLISDFVFSPPKDINAPKYLSIQQTSIRDDIEDKLKKQSLAISVFQMNASFNGIYYSYKQPKGFNISCMRPYYIWLIGTEDQIKTANKVGVINEMHDKLLNSVTFASSKNFNVPAYKITTKLKGDFKPKSTHSITDAKSEQGEFSFNLAVNFNENIQGLKYFSNKSVYRLNNSTYELSVRDLNAKEKNTKSLSPFTHIITLKTTKLQSEKLVIKVLSRVPEWVAMSSSLDDQSMKTNKLEQAKTFGLSNLITGLWQGFSTSQNPNENVITELTLNIEK